MWIQQPHRQFVQINLNKVKWLLSQRSSLPAHWTDHLGRTTSHKGERVCVVEEGAVMLSLSCVQGSRNNPESHMIGLLHPSRADLEPGEVPGTQLSRKLDFEFPRAPGKQAARLVRLLISSLLFNKPANRN